MRPTPAETITHIGGLALCGNRFPATRASVITPMVFCPSLVPCAMAISDADTVCPARYVLVVTRWSDRRVMR